MLSTGPLRIIIRVVANELKFAVMADNVRKYGFSDEPVLNVLMS